MKRTSVVLVALANPPSRPAFVLGNLRKGKLAPSVSDMGIDDGDSSASVCHQFDKFSRLIQMIKETEAANCIEDAILSQIADVIALEG
jgi:hypothetical protein